MWFKKRPHKLAISPIIRLRTPAIHTRFRVVIAGGRIILLIFNTMGCTHGCYWMTFSAVAEQIFAKL